MNARVFLRLLLCAPLFGASSLPQSTERPPVQLNQRSASVSSASPRSSELERVALLMRDYGREITESDFDVATTITEYDKDGKVHKVNNADHRLQFPKGRYSRPGEPVDWQGSMDMVGPRKWLALELYTDLPMFSTIFVFGTALDPKPDWQFTTERLPDGNGLAISYRYIGTCSTFQTDGDGFQLNREICGSGQVTLNDSGPVPLRASFDAVGLPVGSGKKVLRQYHLDSEYRNAGTASSPFLVPSSATATFTFADKKTVVACTYRMRAHR